VQVECDVASNSGIDEHGNPLRGSRSECALVASPLKAYILSIPPRWVMTLLALLLTPNSGGPELSTRGAVLVCVALRDYWAVQSRWPA
jgi:hypothetical protein